MISKPKLRAPGHRTTLTGSRTLETGYLNGLPRTKLKRIDTFRPCKVLPLTKRKAASYARPTRVLRASYTRPPGVVVQFARLWRLKNIKYEDK
jgi:hypothetical protein